ncbi:hydrogenase [Candidatus Methanoperedens nitratireducens]|uniref:Hydrogenase, membrane subunit 2-like protein n=1 Tax=Candidatus Methanoperedens nitratireducens TaxID=1392998 RepID=A0A284VSZ8_9EURY|nr:hydrogenase [Candidatus Methanoperedens nitroreducens]SNQ62415.1 Hydrogenase, membrane subunit 2-like protein [Candidatus Methanoperedens nitroreducens]
MSELVFGSKMMQLLIALILVSTFMILGSTRLYSCVRAFAIQSFLLAGVAGIVAYSTGKSDIYIVAILTLVLKAAVIPYIFIYIIREIKVKREIALYVNISPSLIIGGVLVVISYYLVRSINIRTELSSFALSASISLVSIGLFIMISRKKAIMQMLGILLMENGLFLGAISLTYGMPLLVELGIFFDVLIGVLIMGILIFRINKTFESIDTDMLKTLIG